MSPCVLPWARTMISVPQNPTITAPHLRGPTCSPKIGIERTVIIIGAIKNNAVASGRGKTASAAKNVMLDANTITARSACNHGLSVFRMRQPPSKWIKISVKNNPIADRKNTIWCNGYSPENRFMTMSLTEIKNIPNTMNRMA